MNIYTHRAFNAFKTTHGWWKWLCDIFQDFFYKGQTSLMLKKLLLLCFIFLFLMTTIFWLNHILICYLDTLILSACQNFGKSDNEIRSSLSVEKGQRYRLSRNEIDNSRVRFRVSSNCCTFDWLARSITILFVKLFLQWIN